MIVDLKYVIQENFEICNVLALEKAKIPTNKNKVLSLPILLYKWNLIINFWISFQVNVCMNYAGLSEPGVPWHPQILADNLALHKPRGTDYAHHISTDPPDF